MYDLSFLIQTGTLYASGESSTFTGTGGPFGFSPWTSQFGGVVTTRGIGTEPFNDTVYSVATGDEVIFVIALQNFSSGLRAFDVGLKASLPNGFAAPADGTNLTVTDGTGTDLVFTGDLFGTGIRLRDPVAGLDQDSGLNVVLVTYTLAAGAALPGPYASVLSTAALTHSATSAGGADQGVAVSARTTVVTAAPTPVVQAETSAAAVAKGQPIAFDVVVAIPAGTMRDVRLDTVLPGGTASLKLVSTRVTGLGAGLKLGTPVVAPDGGVALGTITSTGDPAGNTISLRIVVQADGTVSGNALLQTVLSSAGFDATAGRWSATVSSSVGVVVPPVPPGIANAVAGQLTRLGLSVHPLGSLSLSDNDPAGSATLAVTLRDPSLGRLSGGGAGALDATGATFVMSGGVAALQAAARLLVFTPAGPAGTERFTVTLIDPSGGTAQDATSSVTVGAAAQDPIQVASGAPLWVTVLQGTAILRGQGSSLQADRVTGTPVIIGFGARDQLVLPGTGTAWSYVPGSAQGMLAVGGTTLAMAGSYDASRFQVAAGAAGTVVVTFQADPLFDDDYYLAHNPDVAAAGVDPYQHYLSSGWRESRDASAVFSTAYYLQHNPDVAAAGINPLLHYEASGWREGRDPSASFSERNYLAANTDVLSAGINPLLHYVVSGQAEGRAAYTVSLLPPTPLFDLVAYYAANPDVRAAGVDANAHYLVNGWREGRNPNAWFDSRYYLTQNPDVRAAGVNPLLHFESSGWQEGRQPSLVFDDARYLAAYPDVKAAGLNPLAHYLESGRGEGRLAFPTGDLAAADPLVDAGYYDAQLGATLIPPGPVAAQQAAASYAANGWRAGLNPNYLFDTAYYLHHNPDVAGLQSSPLLHYQIHGWREGRDTSAAFSTGQYLAANPDVRAAGVNPLSHYLQNGAQEGRAIYAV